MGAWLAQAGATFFQPSDAGPHLKVVLCDPGKIPSYRTPGIIVVSVCSFTQAWHDDTMILKVGDHPFISHDSYIAYRYARTEHGPSIEAGVKSRAFRASAPFDSAMLSQIVAGALRSPHTAREVKDYLRKL